MILLVANPETWTWGNTWVVTGLGFGIVVLLLVCLVFILHGFGWIMQQATAPKTPKAPKEEKTPSTPIQSTQSAPSEPEKAVIAMALSQTGDEDIAAVAYALFLARDTKHDTPTAMISVQQRETAWNTKTIGLNNIGF